MAVKVTASEATGFLSELGFSIPTALLTPIICRVDSIDPCLDGFGYDDCAVQLIKFYAIALMAIGSGARRIQSQSAPSGASRSFMYDGNAVTWLRDSLRALDVGGCTDSLPITAGETGGFFLVVGGCR